MRIAILARGFAQWGGGIDFIRKVYVALLSIAETDGLALTLVLPGDGPYYRLAALRQMMPAAIGEIAHLRRPRLNWPGVPDSEAMARQFAALWSADIQVVHVDSGRWALARGLDRLRADVTVPLMGSLGRSFPVPWVGYLYDFQHRYFPQFFSKPEIRQRDSQFEKMLMEAKSIIVNALAVNADSKRFYPNATARVVPLPFAPAPHPDWLVDRSELLQGHALQKPYFLVSNQFWLHKDHETAIEALRSVAQHSPSVSLVCTGSTQDYRDPGYFARLCAKIEAAGLSNRVRILGHIPKREQMEIMKHAQAVLQPTLFEGGPGGGSVHDAVSLGVPAIVSDIPVNLEIDDPTVTFFRARDPQDLAQKMRRALDTDRQPPDVAQLLASGMRRRQQYGKAILRSIRYVTD